VKSLAIALAALLGASTAAFAEGPFEPFQVGNWQAGAYTDDLTGKFFSCTALTGYNSGIVMVVTVDASLGWALGFAHPDWNLAEKETIPIELTFDSSRVFRVFGVATKVANKNNLVIVPMPANSLLIGMFRRAFVMTARAKGNLFQFSLKSTAQLLPALAQCAVNHTQTASEPAHEPQESMSSLEATHNSNDYQLEAIQLATTEWSSGCEPWHRDTDGRLIEETAEVSPSFEKAGTLSI